MRGWGARHRSGVLLVAAVILTGCAGAGPSSPAATTSTAPTTSIAPPEATETPASTEATVVCPPLAEGASAPTAQPGVWPGPYLSEEALDAETTELIAAIGNPDTGSPSPAWQAFVASLGTGDAEEIRASAETVIGHLRNACAAVAPYLDQPGTGPWSTDVRGLFDGVARAVAAMRDAAIGDDQAGLEAGQMQMQVALLDHFYQSFKLSDPEVYRVQLQDRQSSTPAPGSSAAPIATVTATASHVRWGMVQVGGAFDGDPASPWLAGAVPAPQWIEVDYGSEATIAGIRLLTYQEIDGATEHLVTVRTDAGEETELVRFTGDTSDGQWLEYTAPAPVPGIRYVRVTTLKTPSMIGWREVEVQVIGTVP